MIPGAVRDASARERSRFGPGLYVHFPFCVSRCGYCDFYVVVGSAGARARFCGDLAVEAALAAGRGEFAGEPFRTLFLGGGTPSLLDGPRMAALLSDLRARFPFARDVEITVECNPESLDPARMAAYRKAGVNRISLGVQSMADADLEMLDRAHTVADVGDRVRRLRAEGFDAVSLDLIYGLPGRSLGSWTETLDRALALEPDHLSAYLLTLEPHVPLSRRLRGEPPARPPDPARPGEGGRAERLPPLPDEELAAAQYDVLRERTAAAGLAQYEISNFARPGKESRHNQNYWVRGDYLGLGPSAHSHREGRRWSNVASLSTYRERLARGELPRVEDEPEPGGSDVSEWIFLGLRRTEGVSWEILRSETPEPSRTALERKTAELTGMGFLVKDGGRLRLSPAAYFVSNAVFTELLACL